MWPRPEGSISTIGLWTLCCAYVSVQTHISLDMLTVLGLTGLMCGSLLASGMSSLPGVHMPTWVTRFLKWHHFQCHSFTKVVKAGIEVCCTPILGIFYPSRTGPGTEFTEPGVQVLGLWFRSYQEFQDGDSIAFNQL